MTRYQILIPDPLLQMGLQQPEGCALVKPLEPGPAGTHWHLFEDPGAPGELEGQRVALTLERIGGVPRITGRHLVVTHLIPADESGLMPCCGVPAWEMHRADSVTGDKELVTCGGAP